MLFAAQWQRHIPSFPFGLFGLRVQNFRLANHENTCELGEERLGPMQKPYLLRSSFLLGPHGQDLAPNDTDL